MGLRPPQKLAARFILWLALCCSVLVVVFTAVQTYVFSRPDPIESFRTQKSAVNTHPVHLFSADPWFALDENSLSKSNSDRFARTLAINGIIVGCCAFICFALFRKLVTGRLEAIARQLSTTDFGGQQSFIPLDESNATADELSTIIHVLRSFEEHVEMAVNRQLECEQKIRKIVDASEEAVLGFDHNGICDFANTAAVDLAGLPNLQAALGKRFEEIFKMDGNGWFAQMRQSHPQLYDFDIALSGHLERVTVIDRRGRSYCLSVRSRPVYNDLEYAGSIVFLQKQQPDQTAERTPEILAAAVDQLPSLLVAVDLEGCIVYVNDRVSRFTGFTREELVRTPLKNIWQAESEEIHPPVNDPHLLHEWEGNARILCKCGRYLDVYSVVSPYRDGSGTQGAVLVSRDITEELAQYNKVATIRISEALHRLSANFAHEFGNPLLGVRSVIDDLAEREELSTQDKTLLLLARGECQRMRTMLKDFNTSCDNAVEQCGNDTVRNIVNAAVLAWQKQMNKAGITCDVRLDPLAASTWSCQRRLQLCLGELLKNAIEAMACGGSILVTGEQTKKGYQLVVGDAGVGIKSEDRERIFEPFFSTKEEIEGTGLGLALAYGAISSLGGQISFASEEGHGSIFSIILPENQHVEGETPICLQSAAGGM